MPLQQRKPWRTIFPKLYQGFFKLTIPLPTSGFLAGRQFALVCLFSEIMLIPGQLHLLLAVGDSYSKNEGKVKESLR